MKTKDTPAVAPIAALLAGLSKAFLPETSARSKSPTPSGYFVAFGVNVKDGVNWLDGVKEEVPFWTIKKEFESENSVEGEKSLEEVNSEDEVKSRVKRRFGEGEKGLDEVKGDEYEKVEDSVKIDEDEK